MCTLQKKLKKKAVRFLRLLIFRVRFLMYFVSILYVCICVEGSFPFVVQVIFVHLFFCKKKLIILSSWMA